MDSRSFRTLLGQFATGVCVITSSDEGVPAFGMTVNSFCSLSLDPALVMWSIGKNSDCFDDFRKVGRYSVNILGKDQEQISKRYSQKGAHQLLDGDWSEGQTGCPVLKNSLALFECNIERRVDGGDHEILIGRVLNAEKISDDAPLIFFGGSYAALSESGRAA